MTYNPRTNTIQMDETSGSFLRGSGQMFFLTMKEIGELPDAPAQIARDWKILKNWLGCKDGEVDSEAYKKVAIAWQSYLALGVSPSTTLDESFAKFREMAIREKWETIQIPEEVGSVFDRMVATDGEIEEKQKSATFTVPKNASLDVRSRQLSPPLQDIHNRLNKIFDGPLKARGLFSTVAETPGFPFSDFNATVSALRSGKANLSFGVISGTAFEAVATRGEKNLHMAAMLTYWIAAPAALIAGAVMSENYFLLLWGILHFPLAFFGTHPHYKKAPLFLAVALIGIFLGVQDESITTVSVCAFFFLAIAGYSFTRRLYNRILISRAFEMESALMFLLGGNYLRLCGADWSSFWTPAWVKEQAGKMMGRG